jgi:protein phosphatase
MMNVGNTTSVSDGVFSGIHHSSFCIHHYIVMSDQEITAELSVEDLAPATEPVRDAPEVVLSVTFAAKTDLGRVRENNEDKFDWWEPDDPVLLARRGRLYAVADGMGGHAAGQIAAEMAMKAMGSAYYSATRDPAPDAISRAIVKANAMVFDTARAIPSRTGMGCTMVAVALLEAEAIVAWAGDSRVYLVRDASPRRLTEDHSWVAEQVRQGVLTEEQAERSAYRNIITRCLGPEPNVTPEVVRVPAQAGDVFLLCSDGLTGVLDDAQIAEIAASRPPSFACTDLIDRANERGGPDNITVAILRINGAATTGATGPETDAEAIPAEAVPVDASGSGESDAPRKRRRFPFGK